MGEVLQLVAVVVCAALTLLTRWAVGTWAHPAAVTAAAWTFFLTVSTIAPQLRGAPSVAWLVVAVVFASLLAAPLRVRAEETREWRVIGSHPLRWIVLVGTVGGPVAALLTMRANDISIESVLDLEAIGMAAREVTWLRYGHTLSTPPLATIMLGLTYGAALAAPFAAAQARGMLRLGLLAGPTIGGSAYAMATTARAGLLIAAAITAGAWLVVNSLESGGRFKFPLRAVTGLGFSALAVAGMFGYVAVSRMGGRWTPSTGEAVLDRFAVYAGGGLPALQLWLDGGAERADGPRLGAQTLAGVSQFLVQDEVGGAYEQVATIGPGLTTTVYTSLRSLIEDFGLGGAILVLLVGTVLASVAFRRAVLVGRVELALVSAVWSSLMLFSLANSFLTFTNVCFGLTVASILILKFVRLTPLDDGPQSVLESDASPLPRAHLQTETRPRSDGGRSLWASSQHSGRS